jgi:hypothetical protein
MEGEVAGGSSRSSRRSSLSNSSSRGRRLIRLRTLLHGRRITL